MHDGGTEFYFPPLRTPARALLLFVVSAAFTGAVYALLHNRVPLLFTAMFALGDLLVLFGFLHVAFGSARIFAGNGEIQSRGGVLGFGALRRTPFAEIASILPVAGHSPHNYGLPRPASACKPAAPPGCLSRFLAPSCSLFLLGRPTGGLAGAAACAQTARGRQPCHGQDRLHRVYFPGRSLTATSSACSPCRHKLRRRNSSNAPLVMTHARWRFLASRSTAGSGTSTGVTVWRNCSSAHNSPKTYAFASRKWT